MEDWCTPAEEEYFLGRVYRPSGAVGDPWADTSRDVARSFLVSLRVNKDKMKRPKIREIVNRQGIN